CNKQCPEAALCILFAAAFRAAPTRHKLLAYWDVFLDDSAPLEINKGEQSDGKEFADKLLRVKGLVDLLNQSSKHIALPNTSLDALCPMMAKNLMDPLGRYQGDSVKTTTYKLGLLKKSVASKVTFPLTNPLTGGWADAILTLKGAKFDTKGLGVDSLV